MKEASASSSSSPSSSSAPSVRRRGRRLKRSQLPLNALRAFEAAARHLSFKRAAEELAVTPAAVSQQIRSLEEYLGVTLFRRTSRSILLTEAAAAALEHLREGFDSIEEACALLQAEDDGRRLTVSVAPSLAAKWLVPRLGRYAERAPEQVVRVIATHQLTDFRREEVDLAIRYGAGEYPGLHVEELMREEVFPVCAPELLEGEHPIRGPADLRHVTLIHDDSALEDESCPTWAMWLKAAGVGFEEGQPAIHFNQTALAIEAAAAGRGVALAKRVLAEADLRSGRLVRPFRESRPVEFAYYIVCPHAHLERANVRGFIDWLREEAGRSWAWEI